MKTIIENTTEEVVVINDLTKSFDATQILKGLTLSLKKEKT